MCSVFWLFWLSYQYLPSDWLERLLRKPNHGEGIISGKSRPKSACDFLGLWYCFIVLLCICVVSCPYITYFPTVMARYSLFVLKVPLNPKQTNNWSKRCFIVVDLWMLQISWSTSVDKANKR